MLVLWADICEMDKEREEWTRPVEWRWYTDDGKCTVCGETIRDCFCVEVADENVLKAGPQDIMSADPETELFLVCESCRDKMQQWKLRPKQFNEAIQKRREAVERDKNENRG